MEETFLEWAKNMTKGTSFASQNVVLTDKDLAPLLKVKSFHPVLRQLIRRVRPQNERQHIRLNLNHLNLKKRLLEEKTSSKLEEKRLNLETSVQEARNEVSREALQLQAIVEEEERLVREEMDLRRQIALLSVAADEREKMTRTMKRLKEPIANLVPGDPLTPSAPQQKSLRQEFANDELKTIFGKLKELKSNLLAKQSEDFHSDKLEVWQLVESYLGQHSPSDVSRALSNCTTKETNSLSQITQQIDLVADAHALRLKYEPSGELVDELNPEGTLETIESMLVQMCGKHVKSHFRNERERRDIMSATESLRNIKNNIHSVAKNFYSDPSLVTEIIRLCDDTIHLSGLRAALSASTPLARRLESRAIEATAAKEKMVKAHDQINQFEGQVKRDVSQLKSLSIATSQSWDQLEEERSSIMAVAEKGLASLELPTPILMGAFLKEVDAVTEIPFQYLVTSAQNMRPIDCENDALLSLSSSAPYVTSWEHIISSIRQKKCVLRQNELLAVEVASLETMATDIKKETLFANQVKEMKEKAKSHDAFLEERIAPLLLQCEQTNGEMERNLLQTRTVIDEWWSQPGPTIKEYLRKKR